MRCEHADTTTILWLYGEGEEAHAEHVRACAACRAVVAEHADVASAVGPALGSLAAPREPARGPAPTWSWRGRGLVAGLCAAAAAGLLWARVVAPAGGDPPAEIGVLDAAVPEIGAAIAEGALAPGPGSVEARLDDLDLAVDRFAHDLSGCDPVEEPRLCRALEML